MPYAKGLEVVEGIAAAYVANKLGEQIAKFSCDGPLADDLANARMFVAAGPMLEALERCATLLDATVRYMRENPIAQEHEVVFDGATCDGSCLMEDCDCQLEAVRAAIALAKGEK